jgi:hypothetical protein
MYNLIPACCGVQYVNIPCLTVELLFKSKSTKFKLTQDLEKVEIRGVMLELSRPENDSCAPCSHHPRHAPDNDGTNDGSGTPSNITKI